MGTIEQLRELADQLIEVAHDCDCNPEDTVQWRQAETASEAADEIESLRQQLAAALAACEAKDTIIVKVGEIASPYRDGLKFNYIADLSQEALAIKPDASALK